MDFDRLVERWAAPLLAGGHDPRGLLGPLAVAVLLIGTGEECARAALTTLARCECPVAAVGRMLEAATYEFAYLRSETGRLLELMPAVDAPIAGVLEAIAGSRLPELAHRPGVEGDVLGPVYAVITPGVDRQARGAFYTPPALAQLMSRLVMPEEGSAVAEPCVGAGGLVLAAARAMRRAGLNPDTVTWHVGDVDRLALSLCAVQLSAHGLHRVVLHPGNALDPSTWAGPGG